MGEPRPGRRVTLTEAAELLGMSRDAVRMRVRRGSLASEKGKDGRVHVFVEPDRDSDHPRVEDEGSGPRGPLIAAKDETIEILREQLQAEREAHAEARRIIAALTSRIPEIEPPRSPVEHLEDEEALRDVAGMEARDAETRQSGHFQRYGAPRRETPSEPPGAPEMAADEQQGRGSIPNATGAQEGSQRAPWWRRMFGG
jgi:hypothetical protein